MRQGRNTKTKTPNPGFLRLHWLPIKTLNYLLFTLTTHRNATNPQGLSHLWGFCMEGLFGEMNGGSSRKEMGMRSG